MKIDAEYIEKIEKNLCNNIQKFSYNYPDRVGPKSGLYSFWLRGCCLYVGESMNIGERLWGHRNDETNPELENYFRVFSKEIEISHVEIKHVNKKFLRSIEKEMIDRMMPKTNIQNNPYT